MKSVKFSRRGRPFGRPLLSLILICAIVVSLLPIYVVAADAAYTPSKAELATLEIGNCTFSETNYKIYKYSVDTQNKAGGITTGTNLKTLLKKER